MVNVDLIVTIERVLVIVDSVHFVVKGPVGTGETVCTTVAVTTSETVVETELPTAPVWAWVDSCET